MKKTVQFKIGQGAAAGELRLPSPGRSHAQVRPVDGALLRSVTGLEGEFISVKSSIALVFSIQELEEKP